MAKRLYRSRDDKMIAGVAGGIAYYFNVDPTIIRLLWALLSLMGGGGLIAYIVAWIIIPEEPASYQEQDIIDPDGEEEKEVCE